VKARPRTHVGVFPLGQIHQAANVRGSRIRFGFFVLWTLATGLYAECFIYFIPTFSPCIFIALGYGDLGASGLRVTSAACACAVLQRQCLICRQSFHATKKPPAYPEGAFLPTGLRTGTDRHRQKDT
jgi:hypothetical protein